MSLIKSAAESLASLFQITMGYSVRLKWAPKLPISLRKRILAGFVNMLAGINQAINMEHNIAVVRFAVASRTNL